MTAPTDPLQAQTIPPPELEGEAAAAPVRHPLKVGVYAPPEIPVSFSTYLEAVSAPLRGLGVELVRFHSAADLPRFADVLWDIRSGGGNAPPEFLMQTGLPPLVVTVHGFAPVSLPGREYFRSWRHRWQHWRGLKKKLGAWQAARGRIARVIAVSNFTKDETVRYTGVEASRIVVCHHGVDAARFAPPDGHGEQRRYYLHVSNDEARKNVERIVEAFESARLPDDVELHLKLPVDSARRYAGRPGVRVMAGHLPADELARLYRGALGFIFPSLYEGFGMPILEAMTASVPVITSNTTACVEVAGDAALLVDPRRTSDLADAISRLHGDADLRASLVKRGHQRAAAFTWEASAAQHAAAFLGAAADRGGR